MKRGRVLPHGVISKKNRNSLQSVLYAPKVVLTAHEACFVHKKLTGSPFSEHYLLLFFFRHNGEQ